jgi:hypothetical protein
MHCLTIDRTGSSCYRTSPGSRHPANNTVQRRKKNLHCARTALIWSAVGFQIQDTAHSKCHRGWTDAVTASTKVDRAGTQIRWVISCAAFLAWPNNIWVALCNPTCAYCSALAAARKISTLCSTVRRTWIAVAQLLYCLYLIQIQDTARRISHSNTRITGGVVKYAAIHIMSGTILCAERTWRTGP